jgi:cytochrome c-type biogenesis protein
MVLQHLILEGRSGSFFLGLAYGLLSGSCTFGFIAPILAIIRYQINRSSWALAHHPVSPSALSSIAVAGTSTALVGRLLESSTWNWAGGWFGKVLVIVIIILGIYFIGNPLWQLFS